MATKSSKNEKQNKYQCLSTITLAGNEIRFVGVNERNNAVHFPNSVNHCAGRLLFVAADVMCSSNISKKNFPRVISRVSKLGFAVKMRLSGFKIEGIHNNNSGIWFFSVQGLFHVAFDIGNMAMQRDCLSQLQDVWLTRYEDPLLTEEDLLKYHKRLIVMPEDCHFNEVRDPDKLEREIIERMHLGRTCRSKRIIIPFDTSDTEQVESNIHWDGGTSDLPEPCHSIETVVTCYCFSAPCKCKTDHYWQGNISSGDNLAICTDHIEVPMQCNEAHYSHNQETFRTRGFRDKLNNLIQTVFGEEVSESFVKQLLLVLEYLNFFASVEQTEAYDNFGCVIFRFIEEFLVLTSLDCKLPDTCKSNFGISQDKFIFLNLLSEWLGQQYHGLEGAIKQSVESFKTENIACIDSLPSAETIIDTLFPYFMKTFVYNWLGYNQENVSEQSPVLNVLSEHCYVEQSPRVDSGNINYQLMQLILEFGSNCLISGIGHVVFSRLQIQNRTDT